MPARRFGQATSVDPCARKRAGNNAALELCQAAENWPSTCLTPGADHLARSAACPLAMGLHLAFKRNFAIKNIDPDRIGFDLRISFERIFSTLLVVWCRYLAGPAAPASITQRCRNALHLSTKCACLGLCGCTTSLETMNHDNPRLRNPLNGTDPSE